MSRPASSSGVVGPHALHLLDRDLNQNSGAISTRPPMDTTIRMPISRSDRALLEDFVFCPAHRPLPIPPAPCIARPELRCRGDARLFGRIDRLIATCRAPQVVGHEQRADDEQQAADGPDDVERDASPRPSRRTSIRGSRASRRPATSGPCRMPDTHIDVM